MGKIADAISWGGSSVTLSMFVVSSRSSLLEPAVHSLEPVPMTVDTYVLDDEDNVLPGCRVIEYDFVYAKLPSNLEALLTRCLHAAQDAGAKVAWFGFEGSFNFGFLLTRAIAYQIYAVLDSEGVSLATDATLSSTAWAERVVRAGERLRRELSLRSE